MVTHGMTIKSADSDLLARWLRQPVHAPLCDAWMLVSSRCWPGFCYHQVVADCSFKHDCYALRLSSVPRFSADTGYLHGYAAACPTLRASCLSFFAPPSSPVCDLERPKTNQSMPSVPLFFLPPQTLLSYLSFLKPQLVRQRSC